jgi:hypothetical protein
VIFYSFSLSVLAVPFIAVRYTQIDKYWDKHCFFIINKFNNIANSAKIFYQSVKNELKQLFSDNLKSDSEILNETLRQVPVETKKRIELDLDDSSLGLID